MTELKGRRPVPRLKLYTALTGYVYEYLYEGYNDTPAHRDHVFTTSADRKTWFSAVVRIQHAALTGWERAHERSLSDAERYAVAKLALFHAFDNRDTPTAMRDAVLVDAALVEELLASIGV